MKENNKDNENSNKYSKEETYTDRPRLRKFKKNFLKYFRITTISLFILFTILAFSFGILSVLGNDLEGAQDFQRESVGADACSQLANQMDIGYKGRDKYESSSNNRQIDLLIYPDNTCQNITYVINFTSSEFVKSINVTGDVLNDGFSGANPNLGLRDIAVASPLHEYENRVYIHMSGAIAVYKWDEQAKELDYQGHIETLHSSTIWSGCQSCKVHALDNPYTIDTSPTTQRDYHIMATTYNSNQQESDIRFIDFKTDLTATQTFNCDTLGLLDGCIISDLDTLQGQPTFALAETGQVNTIYLYDVENGQVNLLDSHGLPDSNGISDVNDHVLNFEYTFDTFPDISIIATNHCDMYYFDVDNSRSDVLQRVSDKDVSFCSRTEFNNTGNYISTMSVLPEFNLISIGGSVQQYTPHSQFYHFNYATNKSVATATASNPNSIWSLDWFYDNRDLNGKNVFIATYEQESGDMRVDVWDNPDIEGTQPESPFFDVTDMQIDADYFNRGRYIIFRHTTETGSYEITNIGSGSGEQEIVVEAFDGDGNIHTLDSRNISLNPNSSQIINFDFDVTNLDFDEEGIRVVTSNTTESRNIQVRERPNYFPNEEDMFTDVEWVTDTSFVAGTKYGDMYKYSNVSSENPVNWDWDIAFKPDSIHDNADIDNLEINRNAGIFKNTVFASTNKSDILKYDAQLNSFIAVNDNLSIQNNEDLILESVKDYRGTNRKLIVHRGSDNPERFILDYQLNLHGTSDFSPDSQYNDVSCGYKISFCFESVLDEFTYGIFNKHSEPNEIYTWDSTNLKIHDESPPNPLSDIHVMNTGRYLITHNKENQRIYIYENTLGVEQENGWNLIQNHSYERYGVNSALGTSDVIYEFKQSPDNNYYAYTLTKSSVLQGGYGVIIYSFDGNDKKEEIFKSQNDEDLFFDFDINNKHDFVVINGDGVNQRERIKVNKTTESLAENRTNIGNPDNIYPDNIKWIEQISKNHDNTRSSILKQVSKVVMIILGDFVFMLIFLGTIAGTSFSYVMRKYDRSIVNIRYGVIYIIFLMFVLVGWVIGNIDTYVFSSAVVSTAFVSFFKL